MNGKRVSVHWLEAFSPRNETHALTDVGARIALSHGHFRFHDGKQQTTMPRSYSGCCCCACTRRRLQQSTAPEPATRGGIFRGKTPKVSRQVAADPNVQDSKGRTPLYLACFHGHERAVRALLDAGACPDLVDIRGKPAQVGCAQKKTRSSIYNEIFWRCLGVLDAMSMLTKA